MCEVKLEESKVRNRTTNLEDFLVVPVTMMVAQTTRGFCYQGVTEEMVRWQLILNAF